MSVLSVLMLSCFHGHASLTQPVSVHEVRAPSWVVYSTGGGSIKYLNTMRVGGKGGGGVGRGTL